MELESNEINNLRLRGHENLGQGDNDHQIFVSFEELNQVFSSTDWQDQK